MGEMIIEAISIANEWLGNVENTTIINLTTAFAVMALDSEDEEIPEILGSAISALKKFHSTDAEKVISRLEEELKMGWAVKEGPQKLVLLM